MVHLQSFEKCMQSGLIFISGGEKASFPFEG